MKKYVLILFTFILSACDGLISISDPTDKIPASMAFSSDQLANSAMNGVYLSMLSVNGTMTKGFGCGAATLFGALSSDELNIFLQISNEPGRLSINTNHIIVSGSQSSFSSPTDIAWTSAYNVIYNANAVIEGIAASKSSQLHDNVRTTITAEAKFIRAFCYFYLVNFYGDVPIVLSTRYNTEVVRSRSPQSEVYQQIVKDLEDARAALPADYSAGGGRRVRVNKWAATALLARVALFTGDYATAAAMATEVIDHSSQFALETDLRNVFQAASREAIWQLDQQVSNSASNATPDGLALAPGAILDGTDTGTVSYTPSPQLLQAFEPGDARRRVWIDSIIDYTTHQQLYYVGKYTTGDYNDVAGGTPTELYMVLRLAEQYLVRAEAAAHNAGGGLAQATGDLNIIRRRAGLPDLPGNLSQPALLDAVAHEWQTELFCEWGFRWFNLKRTGKARAVLSAIPLKQPWAGDHQLLYPVPPADILLSPNIKQNPGY
jgi:hypothetical protein